VAPLIAVARHRPPKMTIEPSGRVKIRVAVAHPVSPTV
jgi:hypothetical protein